MWAPSHFRLGWVGVGVLLGGITVGGAGGADGTGEDGGSGGGAGGAGGYSLETGMRVWDL